MDLRHGFEASAQLASPPAAGASAQAPVQPTSDLVLRWLSRELLITLVQAFGVALLLQLVLLSFGTKANPIGTWAVAAVGILAIRVHRMALPPSKRRRSAASAVRTSSNPGSERAVAIAVARGLVKRERDLWLDPLPVTIERRLTRMYRHVDRISYAVGAPRHYDSGIRPVLTELARDRVRRFAGVDLASDPARARALLGEDLWRALTAPMEAAPTTKDLDRWLTRLEGLDPAWIPRPVDPA